MSLNRLIYCSALLGGWSAFLGWLIGEVLFFRHGSTGGRLEVLVVAAVVGATIGGGLNLLAGGGNAVWSQKLKNLVPGLLGGALGGALGGLVGDSAYAVGLPRALGWLIMGLGIGVVEGLHQRSFIKIRNGLIGGGLGGLIGGLLFDPIARLLTSGTGMSSRATAFVILGLCIGALIGLVQVVLKEAWLTVVDGYRTGRQLILSQTVTVLGRAEHLPLPFLGPMNRNLEPEHSRITRQPDGAFVLEDNQTKLGTRVDGQPVQGPVRLRDGSVIKLGTNFIRFNERNASPDGKSAVPVAVAPHHIKAPPPPPPVKKQAVAVPQAASAPPVKPAAAPLPPPRPVAATPAPPPPRPAVPPPPPPRPAAAPPPPKPAAGKAPPPPPRGPGQLPPPPPPPGKPK